MKFLFLPLMLMASGAFAQVIAPYKFHDSQSYDLPKLYERQERFLKKRLKITPESGLDLAALASNYVSQSNLSGDLALMDKAEVTAKKSIEVLPFYNLSPKLVLAQVAESRHQFAEAIQIASEFLKEKPGDISALTTLVSSNLGFGKLEQASTHAQELVKVSPSTDAWTFLALVSLARGKEEEGLAGFNEALRLEGAGNRIQSTWLRSLMARHFYRKGDIDTAEKYVDSALAIDPGYHLPQALKADITAIRGDHRKAEALYKKATKLRAEPPYFLAWARLRERMNNKKGARALRNEIEKAIRQEIETTPYGHHNELARLLIDRKEAKDREEAVAEAQKDVDQRMTSESYYLLALALMNAERPQEAKIAIDEALKSGEKNCEYSALAGNIEARLVGADIKDTVEGCPQFNR